MTPKELANKLQPVILDLIYDSIDWQMDEEALGLTLNREELLKQLQEL